MALTDTERVRYLLNGGSRCPYCESGNIGADGPIELTESCEGFLNVYCEDCKKRWRDIYRLHDVEDVEND